MMTLVYVLVFIGSALILGYTSNRLIKSLSKVARFLKWKEFVVAFFTMALAASLSNFFVGISSVIHKIPELSFSDVIGGSIVDLTLAAGLAALISNKGLKLKSRTVQGSAIFTLLIAILPILLIQDGILSRFDGILLIIVFCLYIFWVFKKEDRFTKEYNSEKVKPANALKNFFIIILTVIALLIASEGIVQSARYFAQALGLSLPLVGLLIVGIGNALPEISFAVQAAKKGDDWLVIGDLMGSIIIPATLVLGIVTILSPIEIPDFSPFAIARIFLVLAALAFVIFTRTKQTIDKREGLYLIGLYILFLLAEIIL